MPGGCESLQRKFLEESEARKDMQFDFQQQPGLRRWNRDVVKNARPLVSIITPYYNGGKYIQQTCNCVLDQTFPFFEWIIVNDGSTEEEDVRLLDAIAAQDPRIRVLHKENGGISTARNLGIRHAQTDYILPLDGDDLIEPTFVEYCWWMLQKNPGAAWAYSDSLGFQGIEYLWEKKFDPILLKTENHLTSCALIRKEALLAIGGYCEKNKHYNEDWYAWLRLVARGEYPAQSCGEHLMWYRRGDTGVLSMVKRDKAILQANRELIHSAARDVKNPHPPVHYPKAAGENWDLPRKTAWDKSFYANKKKTHIAFLFPHLEMGGADKFNLDLLSRLNPEQYEVGILTTVPAKHRWIQRFRQITPDIFNLPNFLDTQDFAEFISYYLVTRQVDVLFVSNSYYGYYLVPWLRQHFPELAIVDYVHMEEWYWRGGGYARTSGMVGAITEKTYVCNSATAQVLTDHFGRNPETVETVHIGVDETYFDKNLVPQGQLYAKLNLDKNRPVVLFICRIHPQKRPFLMLEIAREVAARLPQVAFAVVGDGPQLTELRRTAKKQGLNNTVYFLGAQEDVRPFYRDAKVTLVCSLKEGLSLTAYESCAMGVPVVSAHVGGQKDLIDDTVGALIPMKQDEARDVDARVFSREEITAYADALVKYLTDDDLWQEASCACRTRIEQDFTVSKMADYFHEEFRRLTGDIALSARRRQVSLALNRCAPLAGELVGMLLQEERQQQSAQFAKEGYLSKVQRTLRQEGFAGLVKKALRWSKLKVARLLGRIG